jgi:carboxylesterase type B
VKRLTGTLKAFIQLFLLLNVGFLSAGVKELPGNAGLFDMALALEWIRDYISFFGGSPNRVTVFGQGTGASSAVLLSLSQITHGSIEAVSCC